VTDDPFSVEESTRAGWVVVRLRGVVDLANAGEIESRLLAAAGESSLALELSDLSYLDSAGLAMIDRIARVLSEGGRSIEVIAAEGSVAHAVLGLALLAGVPVVAESTVESA
jgi:anti-anti-sigma factor